ncbi:hypothetical protein BCR36DRAFT_105322 [Piromyces finnis]|uniref:L domain-like protein n=1 Tax=Piromyces finnis TaxID=1754191 RepID=A0A1Y1V3B3_9FUNG|nr:hypothetical protein BCR36DRAFT_105322 [Piromyces finnis]|eukprot:ORX46209.1 hypothetical protein BCR36DRAFT_105322 [Piromyces finnis]
MLSIYSHLSARLEFKLPTSNNIETLKLSRVELSDEQMKEISFSSNLKELNCINTVFYKISNNTEQSINQLKNLQSLSINTENLHGPKYTDFNFRLSELKELKSLDMENFIIGKDVLNDIACLPKLDEL